MTVPAVRSSGPLTRDPFGEFENLYRRLDRWMDQVAGHLDGGPRTWSRPADVTETGEAYLVKVELPGVKRRDVDVELVGGELVISGELKERRKLVRRGTGRFSYRMLLPRDVEADHIKAGLTGGVLTVRVPKSEAARRRRIAVNGR